MSLHVTHLGDAGPRVVFFHGLFGQGKNWTQVAKALSADHRVTLVDMPNHGRSDWTEHLSYPDLADRCADLIDPSDPVRLVGHSMGGKTAMALALRRPELVERLAVVDISPVAYPRTSEFGGYIAAMQAIDLATLTKRADADAQLVSAVPNATVRSFLLQNLRHDADGWRWQPNLALLGAEHPALGDWPVELETLPPYQGKVLWIAGEKSNYILPEYAAAMTHSFPRVRRVTVKGAGHWVHSEAPDVFLVMIRQFLV